jgi:hypothetical protein
MAASDVLDLFKEHKAEYSASQARAVFVDIPEGWYLTAEGKGPPGEDRFQTRIGGLYAAAYTLKMTRKFGDGQPRITKSRPDYKVSAVEGVYWVDGIDGDFFRTPKEQWQWKLMLRTPSFIQSEHLDAAKNALRAKEKPGDFEEVRLESFAEGRCVQMLHVGPYDKEEQTLQKMAEFAEQNQCEFHGRHHEIYLSDPRRCAPERLRTILRMPVRER